jgi:glucose/arabinose dehydrogenase
MKRIRPAAAFLAAALLLVATPARAQIGVELVAQGLASPIGFVQDPADAAVQYIVEQGGRIRVLQNGTLLTTDFLDLSDETVGSGEQGLLGFALDPDYGATGRVWVNFTNLSGNTVVARFTRSAGNPLQADPDSRFDLLWPGGDRFIFQPFGNHNGGHMAFGPDNRLYIGMGDGGSGSDPLNNAQTPGTLLGKMLRIDVSVPDTDVEGYDVPADNPFVGNAEVLPEIWDFGLRNPWRWSFDDFGAGNTDALIIGDVGQGAWEEVDYEPAGAGGRNYGWRIKEGFDDHDTTEPAYFQPLTPPIHVYSHTVGRSITGGYVYRGSALSAEYRGRYFFADFIFGRVWSAGLAVGGGGASVLNIVEHTAELGAAAELPSSFGRDAAGELYLVAYGAGRIYRIVKVVEPDGPSNLQMSVEAPAGGNVTQPFAVSGWAVDLGSGSGPGVQTVHVWAVPFGGAPAIFLGASYGLARPDLVQSFGLRFQNAGFSVPVVGLPVGQYSIQAFPFSRITSSFGPARVVNVTIPSQPRMFIDLPQTGQTWPGRVMMAGWALDAAATTGTGVAAIEVWAQRGSETARFVGNATLGFSRPDVAAAFGSQFLQSGWFIDVVGLPPGTWTVTAFFRSVFGGAVIDARSVVVTFPTNLPIHIDDPLPGAVLGTGVNRVAGWALDPGAAEGSGIAAVHIWATPVEGGSPTFLGGAALGVSRPDVGAVFGAQFDDAGYGLLYTLPPGTYDLTVYAMRVSTGTFDDARVVRVTIQ